MKNIKINFHLLLFALPFMMYSCDKFEPYEPEENEILDGPIEGLTQAQLRQFVSGDVAFNDQIFTSSTGLGPIFNANSCVSCHAGDGKGTPFSALTKFGQTDDTGNQFLHMGGPQLQTKALPGYSPETLPAGASYTKLIPPGVTGLGYLQYVSDADIIAMSDPNDMDGDGISGVPNWKELDSYLIPSENAIEQDGKYIHRFGRKASVYDLLNQTVFAYNEDMGITSIFDPVDTYTGLTIDPEVSSQTIRDQVAYLKTLKAPIPRDQDDPQVMNGRELFNDINCAACHKPTLQTSYSPIEALSNKTFHPFTDLLLHDMGSELDDGYTEGSALSSEWRTPPLWGLGLSPDSQGGVYYLMHDGRANSIDEAILMHGGEATDSKNAYQNLNQDDKSDVIKFLESL